MEKKNRIGSVRDLEVYRKAFAAAMQIYEVSKGWRKRRYEAAFLNKLSDAAQEAAEAQTWLEFALACRYIGKELFDNLDSQYEQIFAMLHGMENKAKSFCNASQRSDLPSASDLPSSIILSQGG